MRHLAVLLTILAVPAAATAATKVTDVKGPTVKITGLPAPSSCQKQDRKIRFKVTDRSGVRRVDVYVDRKRAGRARGSSSLTIDFPKKLHTGRHRIGVTARDNVGNFTHKVVTFRVCA